MITFVYCLMAYVLGMATVVGWNKRVHRKTGVCSCSSPDC